MGLSEEFQPYERFVQTPKSYRLQIKKITMPPLSAVVGAAGRRGSLVGLRGSLPLSACSSCPDLSTTGLKPDIGDTTSSIAAKHHQQRRSLTVLNPRAPKIRYLNASHTLLMEMEKHVKKVQVLYLRHGSRCLGIH